MPSKPEDTAPEAEEKTSKDAAAAKSAEAAPKAKAAKKKTTKKKAVAKKTVAKKAAKAKESTPARLRVRQIRSTIRRQKTFKRTLEALGIRHHQGEVVVSDTPSTRGMLTKVQHLVRVTPEE